MMWEEIDVTNQVLGGVLTDEQKQQFCDEGYLIIRGLFKKEVKELLENFMMLHAGEPLPGFAKPLSAEEAKGDVLKQFPRMVHPHRVNDIAMTYMLHPKVMNILTDLFQEEPLAAQSMFYFKPPGAKGQALHQDNFYLKVEPGTCIAAWTAIDSADEDNGGLVVVPKSNNFDLECPHLADTEQSFTKTEVNVPDGYAIQHINMDAGDVLFFNGSMIHGSYPNRSKDRFRRAFICHYANKSLSKISGFYKPMYRYDGTEVTSIEESNEGGPCGEEHKATAVH
jgi:phytanoyl-CoA hydroxylase